MRAAYTARRSSGIALRRTLRQPVRAAIAAFCAAEFARRPSFTASVLGARFGYQTSYQSCAENSDFGTPRGGRRTVPMRGAVMNAIVRRH